MPASQSVAHYLSREALHADEFDGSAPGSSPPDRPGAVQAGSRVVQVTAGHTPVSWP